MTGPVDYLLLAVLVLDLYIVATGRLGAAVQASALQGLVLAAVPPVLLAGAGSSMSWAEVIALAAATAAVKAAVIPWLLMRTIRGVGVRREVEPFVSLHNSLLLAATLVGAAFWLGSRLVLPRGAPSALVVPVALATFLLGFLVLVNRKQAVSQVVGYLVLENGVFLFGQCVAREMPHVVELAILLDVLVGVFVMGIAIHHIQREFDHIDTRALSLLKD